MTTTTLDATTKGGEDFVSSSQNSNDFDWDAFERKNMSRKKFGLEALTEEQFLEVEAQVQQMELEQHKKFSSMAQETAEVPVKKRKGGLFNNLFNDIFEDTCESNYDCQRPQVCCDMGVKKMCCSSGQKVRQWEPALMRVPSTNVPYPQTPKSGGNYY
eukprot:CAMPEP_0202446374 /NCGR_PEP_ID=MMETSP1360-20130828/4876_1 /ASSEMBLY_ACC=CAM_ASM_000848 /TAXON_ID=515479 /ORGANISM="Licmophora paradoxa, Strain CCMP2313" /LENGTH=157 /DNA_ID=CAMNT_0049062827 /DNA_START=61 /DNA_END=534 /DNA_ORIENTATION=+